MAISHRNYGKARVLAPKGRLDHDNCEAFRADIAPHLELCARDGEALVLDMSGLEYVSSAGLRCCGERGIGPDRSGSSLA